MNDEPSIVLPLIGTALCTVLLGFALGYASMVDEEIYVLMDDEADESAPECTDSTGKVALVSDR